MQGDIHRAKQKERERLKDKPAFSQILTGVDDMRIDDLVDSADYHDEKISKYYNNEEVSIVYMSRKESLQTKVTIETIHLYNCITYAHFEVCLVVSNILINILLCITDVGDSFTNRCRNDTRRQT